MRRYARLADHAMLEVLRPSDRLSWRRAGDKILASGNRTETTRYAWALQDSNLTGQEKARIISASCVAEPLGDKLATSASFGRDELRTARAGSTVAISKGRSCEPFTAEKRESKLVRR